MLKSEIEAIYPLSSMQEGMLLHTLYAPAAGIYVVQMDFCLEGKLNIAPFKQAWQQTITRHTPLRTLFMWEHRDKSLQVVLRQVSLPWAEYDWRGLSPEEQEEQLASFLRADRRQGFELNKAPLMRLTLIHLAEERYQLIWSFHHLILDGWSTSWLVDEVFARYEAYRRGEDIYLAPSRPFRDYITWLQQQDLDQAETFWRQALSDFTRPTQLPFDCLPGHWSGSEQEYAEQQVQLSPAKTAALQKLAQQHQVTLNTLIQGAWAILLSRYSGDTDVVFGATVSGRPPDLAGVEAMVGMFINTLPARVKVSPEATLSPWLKELQAQQIEVRHYEYSPLAQLQGWSEVEPGQALFEHILVFENYPLIDPTWTQGASITITEVRLFEKTNYPLTVTVEPGPALRLQFSYNSQCFGHSAISRMLGHFLTLLEGMVGQPAARLADLSLLTAAEERQLLVEWNNTATAYPREQAIHQLFEAQAAETPEAVAVIFEGEALTYDQLNRRANQLAHRLRALGIGPEVGVGICVERSLEMVIGILGVLKAGGFYLPLDPTYPPHRLAFMIADVQTPLLLTQKRLAPQVPEGRHKVISLDVDGDLFAQASQDNPANRVSPENLAYVMYTSGSTGLPKGVSVTHRNVVRLVKNSNFASLSAAEVFLQLAPISFDASTLELWGPLLNGGRLVIFPAYTPSLAQLAQALRQYQITTLWLTAGLFQQMVEAHPESLASIRQLLAGGDVLSAPHVQKIVEARRTGQVINGYGPTENTTFTCCYPMTTVEEVGSSVSIGRPVANTQVYILDRSLQPAPIGVPGELYIGGDGLARGYFNRPDLTAERFIPNPFGRMNASREGGRMKERQEDEALPFIPLRDPSSLRLYKTGDLARYRPDGNIEFLGRIDQQVKIRGIRIELGEIETVLAQHPAVREAVVLAREDKPGYKYLIAYVVLHRAEEQPDLRYFLRQKLPDYMIPSNFVLLERLPLTANGKVDRQALPLPGSTPAELGETYTPPRDPIEKIMGDIWLEVLGLARVDIYSNFFELGGHSLMATQIISRIYKTFQVELPLRCLFETPTVAGLAEALIKHEAKPGQVAAIARLRQKIETMSPDEIQTMLRKKKKA